MKTTLNVFLQGVLIASLSYDADTQLWALQYEPGWLARDDRFALSPALNLNGDPAQDVQKHSQMVRVFFENLLPEGQALEDASMVFQISRFNSFGLIRALGRETSGALEILPADSTDAPPASRGRHVSREDISSRIRSRPYPPFTVWDGRVRLSIAGFQDKLAVLEEERQWYLVDGRNLASTHLLKPEPLHRPLAGMTTNERFCMAVAGSLGIPVATTRLEHVPEPLLVVERFDRVRTSRGVTRLHCIDGCQALGLPVSMKYERPFGNGRDVRRIRDGASLPQLFALLDRYATSPTLERLALLRWTILQVLIGNVDGHAKNLTFLADRTGLRLAPAYDLVCGLLYEQENVDDTLAMSIGDEFEVRKLGAYDWAQFAVSCGLPGRLVGREMAALAKNCAASLDEVAAQIRAEGGDPATIGRVSAVVESQISIVLTAAPSIQRIVREEWGEETEGLPAAR